MEFNYPYKKKTSRTLGSTTFNCSLFQSFGDKDNQFKGFQEKRVPSGFMGMRGKKYFGFKRAPSGFMGMRGKKNYEEVDGNSIYDEDLESELYQELMDERLLMSNLMEDNQMNEMEKRAPSGFMGMRGKKSISNNDYFESESKRAPMGFQGVRGKKSQFENFLVTEDKRGPITGFFGMRGKKQPNVCSLNTFVNQQLYNLKVFPKHFSRLPVTLVFVRSLMSSVENLLVSVERK